MRKRYIELIFIVSLIILLAGQSFSSPLTDRKPSDVNTGSELSQAVEKTEDKEQASTEQSNSPSPSPESDGAKDGKSSDTANPVEFKEDKSKYKRVEINSCGDKYGFNGYEIEPGVLLIPLSDENTIKLLSKFDVKAKYDSDSKEVIMIREEKVEMRMKIDYDFIEISGEKKEIPVPARVLKGMVHISPNSISKFMWACFLYDKKRNIYFMDPFLLDVSLETTKQGLNKVVARGTGPFKYRILKLREPTRFVVDVMNAVLDGKARELNHPVLGAIRFSQNELMGEEGNVVRIVIPETEDYEIALGKPRSPKYVEAELQKRNTSAPVQDLAVQTIENIDVIDHRDLVTITIDTTGPIQLEWSRLLPPDDRFFIDIPGLILPEKKKVFNLRNDFLPTLTVAQFEPLPNAAVRMVLPLEGPRKVTLQADPDNHKRFKVFVSKETIDPKNTAKRGFLVTEMPSKGLVICIDPGHGGGDPGAVNLAFGAYEKNFTLDISQRLHDILKKNGWTVIMTRNTDRDVTYAGSPDYEELGARTSIPNDLKAQIFISVHINAAVNKNVSGYATYWYKPEDRELAGFVQKSMIADLGVRDLGIRRERFFLLHRAKMPAILLECGFISNASDVKALLNPAFRQKIAESVAKGVQAYAVKMKMTGTASSPAKVTKPVAPSAAPKPRPSPTKAPAKKPETKKTPKPAPSPVNHKKLPVK